MAVTLANRDIFLPDGRHYSIRGSYVASLLNGYSKNYLPKGLMPRDEYGQEILFGAATDESLNRWDFRSEVNLFAYIIGFIYFVFGNFTIYIRIFNIALSVTCAYLFFDIAKRQFGILTANLFLLTALFLPTQFFYSIMLSKDLLRMFGVSLILWFFYGGVIWREKQKV